MKKFLKKLYFFLWYFIRPKYTKHSIRLLCKSINNYFLQNKNLQNSYKSCLAIAITTEEAINFFFNKKIINVENKILYYLKNYNKSDYQTMGGGSNLQLLYNICQNIKPKCILESGVAYGWSSLIFLIFLNDIKGKLISINLPYPDTKKINLVGAAVPNNLKKNWNLYSGADKDLLPKILKINNEIDIFHYDSDKSYEGKYWALNSVWPYISNNGFILCDDVQDNYAFFDFVNNLNVDFKIINYENKYIGMIKKS